ncbi:MAG: NAD(P)H-hydrate epimerase, partial [Magnetospiraceae bacterium]
MHGDEILTIAEMYRADALAIAGGISGFTLMDNAGHGITREILERWAPCPVTILCGPGNNGGDGFVVARLLKAHGWPVTLALLGAIEKLCGDAAAHAARWDGDILACTPEVIAHAGLVVDALFGAGLSKPVGGAAAATLQAAAGKGLPLVAVDMPSGVQGDTGEILGSAVPTALTVSFFRPKLGHFLYPGRGLIGELKIVDIGIPETVLAEIKPRHRVNQRDAWRPALPQPQVMGHKY